MSGLERRQSWHRLGVVGLGAVLMLGAGMSARSGAGPVATEWVVGHNSKVRLIGAEIGAEGGGTRLLAGVEIELAEGWKTYWRTPGDSGGMPPEFDWDQSENVKTARLLYPAPRRLEDSAGESVGYKGKVVFPIEIEATDRGRPVELRLGMLFGVCKDICIPADAELTLTLPPMTGQAGEGAQALIDARASVPVTLDGASDSLPRIEAIAAELTGDDPRLIIDARFAAGAAGADLFIETDDWSYLPQPKKLSGGADGLARFRLSLKNLDSPAGLGKRTLILTLVSDRGNVEVRRRLDR